MCAHASIEIQSCHGVITIFKDLRQADGSLRNVILSMKIKNPVFSCEVACKKPAAEIYQEGLRRVQTAAHETLFVGDGGSNELSGALQAGLIPVLYRPKETEEPFRPEAQEWQGPCIDSLLSVPMLVSSR